MKLTPEQLPRQLSENLAPLYLISGDELLLVSETEDQIRAAAGNAGFTEREIHVAESGYDWPQLTASVNNLSLFSSRRIIELRLPTGKPGKAGASVLVAIAENPPPDTLVLVTTPQIDSRSAKSRWVTSIAQAGVWVPVRALPPEKLPAWLATRMRNAGMSFDRDAIELLAARVEGNLLAARQEIEKLVLLSDDAHVSLDLVQCSVADGARFDVFQLADAAVGQDPVRALRVLYGLQREGAPAPLTLWALVREIRALADLRLRIDQGSSIAGAMADAHVWRARQGIVGKALRQHSNESVGRLINKACVVDRIVKGARFGQPWNALTELTLELANPRSAKAA